MAQIFLAAEEFQANFIFINNLLLFRYKIQKPSRNTYIVAAHFSACFERNGDCLFNTTLFDDMEIPRTACVSTNESE